MKKSEIKAIGFLFLISAVIYPFVWIYDTFGVIGLCSVILLFLLLAIARKFSRGRKAAAEQKSFDDLAILILNNRLSPDGLSELGRGIRHLGWHHSTLIGNLKQIRESVDLALTSKNRDVAESRMEFAIERGNDVVKNHWECVSPYVISQMKDVISEAQSKFKTQLHINISNGCIEKATGLKTNKGKLKHLALAKDAIEEGIALGVGDLQALNRALQSVNGMIAVLG